MQERATKCVITASYDDDSDNGAVSVEDKARAQYEKEIKTGYYLPTHVFYRDLARHRVTKFNFLIPVGEAETAKVSVISFPMLNTSRSSLERVATVGDDLTGINVDNFRGHFKEEGEKVEFVDEGEPSEWSFSSTVERGAACVRPEKGELIYVLMGDSPLRYNLSGILNDPDIGRYDLISDMNSRWKTNRHWPREYHWKLHYRGRPLFVKESQEILLDVPKIREVSNSLNLGEGVDHVFDFLYGSRKAHGSGEESREGKFRRFLRDNPVETILFSIVAPLYAGQLGVWYLRKRDKPLPLSPGGIRRGVKFATGAKVLLKAENNDPGTIEDIDGLSDWANLSEMLITAGNSIYPYCSEMIKFGKSTLAELRRSSDFYYGFEDYMNSVFRGYGLQEPFVAGGIFRNPFTSDEMAKISPFNATLVKRSKMVIRRSIRRHRRYLRRLKRKGIRF